MCFRLIRSYGWANPPLVPNNPFQRYLVQVADIGPQTYGYVTFAISLFFMKPCSRAALYCFSNAEQISANANTPPTYTGALATIGGSYSGIISNTYASNVISLPTEGTYRVQLDNSSTAGALRASVVAEVGGSLLVRPLSEVAGPQTSADLAIFTVPEGAVNVALVITNQVISATPEAFGAATYSVSTQSAAPLTKSQYLPLANF